MHLNDPAAKFVSKADSHSLNKDADIFLSPKPKMQPVKDRKPVFSTMESPQSKYVLEHSSLLQDLYVGPLLASNTVHVPRMLRDPGRLEDSPRFTALNKQRIFAYEQAMDRLGVAHCKNCERHFFSKHPVN